MTTGNFPINKNMAHRTDAGFTLVEALVSMFILSVTLTAIVSLVSRSIEGSILSQQYLIASKLAQEGVELIRAKRNNNLAEHIENPGSTAMWYDNLEGIWEVASGDIGDALSYGNEFPTAQTPSQVFSRYITPSLEAGKFTYTEGQNTEPIPGEFTRVITVEHDGDYVTIESKVNWNGIDEPFIVNSTLYGPS